MCCYFALVTRHSFQAMCTVFSRKDFSKLFDGLLRISTRKSNAKMFDFVGRPAMMERIGPRTSSGEHFNIYGL